MENFILTEIEEAVAAALKRTEEEIASDRSGVHNALSALKLFNDNIIEKLAELRRHAQADAGLNP